MRHAGCNPTDPTARGHKAVAAVVLVALLLALLATPAHAGGKSKKGTDRAAKKSKAKTEEVVTGQSSTSHEPRTTLLAAPAASSAVERPTAESDVAVQGAEAYDPISALGSMYNVVDQIHARELWQQGITGAGIDVAVIDTGVAPVPALTGADKVVAMVDLSFEAGVPEATYLDTNGHGTHMAGIIAGRTPGADPTGSSADPEQFFGVAPGAGIVSVKVGDNTGAVDVSQVIAGIDWVVEHKNEGGLNIRVINLSYGTDSVQDYRIDPLAYAVERAWDAGIVVVVAAGNEGWNGNNGLANPAHDPYVLAVGAAEATDDGFKVPSWTSVGELATLNEDGAATPDIWDDYSLWFSEGYGGRIPDLVAPGAHIDSLRVPASRVATEHPEGFVTDELLRGSGTSQAAAVVTGAAALLLDARPELTPDQVKALLMESASLVPWALPTSQGSGVINVAAASALEAPSAVQQWERSTGLGSLDAARGTQRVVLDGVTIEGEVTVFGTAWDPEAWIELTAQGASWTGASWTGASWTGASWTGASWTGASWTGASWTGASWTGASWTGASWTGASWTGASWT